jgi:phosphoglycerate dehydrogenase-like enzyme
LAADRPIKKRELTRLVFGWDVPADPLAKLRSAFPDLDAVVALGPDFITALPGAQAAVAWQISTDELTEANDLLWFQSIGAGVERVLLPEMRQRGLVVTNSSGIHAINIAEHVLAMMLAFARGLPQLIRAQVRREWLESVRGGVFELNGQTLHIAGYGDIGRQLGRDAKALGMRVTATRRHAGPGSDEIAGEIAGFERIAEQLANADHVAICLPQTPATVGMFNASLIGAMKRG